jgi:hypothetical protein
MPEIRELLTRLESDDPAQRAAAVERAAVTVERLIHGIVDSIESAGGHHHALLEHIHRFGPSLAAPLEARMQASSDDDARVLCALLLLKLKSEAGVPILLAALRSGSSWMLPAAMRLAEAGIAAARLPIEHQLRTLPFERGAELVGLLHALRSLQSGLPADLAARFSAADAPAEARRIFEQALAGGDAS